MPSSDFVINVITLFPDDFKSVLDWNSIEDIEEVLFFDKVDGEFLLTVNLGDDLLDTARTGFSFARGGLHDVLDNLIYIIWVILCSFGMVYDDEFYYYNKNQAKRK